MERRSILIKINKAMEITQLSFKEGEDKTVRISINKVENGYVVSVNTETKINKENKESKESKGCDDWEFDEKTYISVLNPLEGDKSVQMPSFGLGDSLKSLLG